jgi:hypothetical protein
MCEVDGLSKSGILPLPIVLLGVPRKVPPPADDIGRKVETQSDPKKKTKKGNKHNVCPSTGERRRRAGVKN